MTAPRAYDCRQVIQRLDDYVDRELSPGEVPLVQAHLETCAHCASAYKFEANVLAELKAKLQRIDLPQSMLDKVRSALRTGNE